MAAASTACASSTPPCCRSRGSCSAARPPARPASSPSVAGRSCSSRYLWRLGCPHCTHPGPTSSTARSRTFPLRYFVDITCRSHLHVATVGPPMWARCCLARLAQQRPWSRRGLAVVPKPWPWYPSQVQAIGRDRLSCDVALAAATCTTLGPAPRAAPCALRDRHRVCGGRSGAGGHATATATAERPRQPRSSTSAARFSRESRRESRRFHPLRGRFSLKYA